MTPKEGRKAGKTRERILDASLALFNEFGEPSVTTNHIADELDISPGNLYYHFRSKEEIILILYDRFEIQIKRVLEAPQARTPDLEDMWLYVHLIFESIWEYRFLYRDLDNLLARIDKLNTRFKRIMDRKIATAAAICEGLIAGGMMRATPQEVGALARNIALIATYWLSFQKTLTPRAAAKGRGLEGDHLGHGVFQVIAAVVPYLQGDAHRLLDELSRVYLD